MNTALILLLVLSLSNQTDFSGSTFYTHATESTLTLKSNQLEGYYNFILFLDVVADNPTPSLTLFVYDSSASPVSVKTHKVGNDLVSVNGLVQAKFGVVEHEIHFLFLDTTGIRLKIFEVRLLADDLELHLKTEKVLVSQTITGNIQLPAEVVFKGSSTLILMNTVDSGSGSVSASHVKQFVLQTDSLDVILDTSGAGCTNSDKLGKTFSSEGEIAFIFCDIGGRIHRTQLKYNQTWSIVAEFLSSATLNATNVQLFSCSHSIGAGHLLAYSSFSSGDYKVNLTTTGTPGNVAFNSQDYTVSINSFDSFQCHKQMNVMVVGSANKSLKLRYDSTLNLFESESVETFQEELFEGFILYNFDGQNSNRKFIALGRNTGAGSNVKLIDVSCYCLRETFLICMCPGIINLDTLLTSYNPYTCPTGQSFIRDGCVNTCSGSTYNDGSCTATCPSEELTVFYDSGWQECSDRCLVAKTPIKLYKELGGCQTACTSGIFDVKNECLSSCSGYLYPSGLCLSTCSLDSIGNYCFDKASVTCTDFYQVETATCTSSCTGVVAEGKYCMNSCLTPYKYKDFSTDTCLSDCTKSTDVILAGDICFQTHNCNFFSLNPSTCLSTCSDFANGNECVASCPINSFYYHKGNDKGCNSTCPSGIPFEPNGCFRVCSSGQFVDLDTTQCVDSCTAIGKKQINSEFHCVSSCKSKNLYEHSNKCYSSCSEVGLTQYDSDNVCQADTQTPEEPPETPGCSLLTDKDTGACVSDCGAKFKQGSYCVSSCSQFIYKGECIYSCYYPLIEKENSCVEVCDDFLYRQPGAVDKCVSICPAGTVPVGKYCSEDTLVCPYGKVAVNGECITCSQLGQVYSNGKCVSACPTGQETHKDAVCEPCSSFNKVREGDKCLQNCSEGYIEVNGYCSSCSPEQFLFEGDCVEECEHLIQETNQAKLCFKCEEGTYLQNGECVKVCQGYQIADFSSQRCVDLSSRT